MLLLAEGSNVESTIKNVLLLAFPPCLFVLVLTGGRPIVLCNIEQLISSAVSDSVGVLRDTNFVNCFA